MKTFQKIANSHTTPHSCKSNYKKEPDGIKFLAPFFVFAYILKLNSFLSLPFGYFQSKSVPT